VRGNAFNFLAMFAALMVGYGIFVSNGDSGPAAADVSGVLKGYYLHNAVITETTDSGAPHFRVAAMEVSQNLQEKTVSLGGLRVDYLKPAVDQPGGALPAHWVLNADRGTAIESFHRLALQGNVQAHNLGAPRGIVFNTHSLDVDTEKATATSRDAVQIDVEKNTVNGRGFFADFNREHFNLDADVSVKLAQAARSEAGDTAIQVPEILEGTSSAYDGSCLTMTDAVSKTPPYVKAQRVKACGRDIANGTIEFRRNVSVELPKSGSLHADSADVTMKDGKVAKAHFATDAPNKFVEFSHRAKDNSDKLIRGHAATIDYDVEHATLHLEGNVWFHDERGELTHDQLDYNLTTEAWRGTNTRATINRQQKNSNSPTETP
jgi:LPS export ABC transporter protein LptC